MTKQEIEKLVKILVSLAKRRMPLQFCYLNKERL